MTTPPLSDPQEVIGKQWSKHQSPEQARILGLARDALRFVHATGQGYRFEDFRKSLKSGAHHSPGTFAQPRNDFASLEEHMNSTKGFFTELRDETDSVTEKKLIQVILDTLHFISSTGQYSAFREYLEHIEAGAPPYVIASFDTKENAEAWLRNQPIPLDSANVLIADNYHYIIHDQETGIFRLPRIHDLEHYLAELKHDEPPVAAASFATLEEADAWLRAQPEPARWAWVSVAGEIYLAVYHPNIHHRALYPLSMATGYEVEPDEP